MAQYSSTTCHNLVSVENGQFQLNNKPYYFIGTNFWYGPLLGASDGAGDRSRLLRELDALKSIGIRNLRILVGAESGSKNVVSVEPVLLSDDDTLNPDLLDGLDFMLAEMGKRDMKAVLYLTNSWDWSGGYGYYLRRIGLGDSPDASGDGWDAYCNYAAQMNVQKKAQRIFHQYIKKIITRRNKYSDIDYSDDATIMAWQLVNEPRPFRMENAQGMVKFLRKTSKLIKKLDPNHLVSIGGEGIIGCQYDSLLFDQISSDPCIDYITIHIWPKNWNWVTNDKLSEDLDRAIHKTDQYIKQHLSVAQKLKKPIVIEEFGYPRDNASYALESTTDSRNEYYTHIFQIIQSSKQSGGLIAGCNFWGWGGFGRPASLQWTRGNDFLCDPPHEPQGWYSVFTTDISTINLILNSTQSLNNQ